MKTKTKVKKSYPEDFRSMLGFTAPWTIYGFSAVVFGLFLLYLTDYSNIDAGIGKVGYAAAFGTTFLIISRVVDAIDDPIQAWIMDNAKERKFGKYRMFTLIGITINVIGLIGLFSIPTSVKSNPIALWVWALLSYLLFEMGTAFNGITPIIQKSTTDPRVRTKIMTAVRLVSVLAAMPGSFFVPIAAIVNITVNNMSHAVTLTVVGIAILFYFISLIGVFNLKEPYRPKKTDENSSSEENNGKIGIKELIFLIGHNKPLWTHNVGFVIGNMAYGFSVVMIPYFLKWFYFADPATGIVDSTAFAAFFGINSALAIPGLFLAPLFAPIVVKKLGSVDKAARFCMLLASIGYLLMFVMYIFGILHISPWIFVVTNVLVGLSTSVATIPFLLLNVEVADYVEYSTGKNMAALSNSVNNVLSKSSSALTAAATGGLLVLVGYSVDGSTGAFAGNMSSFPKMVTGMTTFVTLLPAVFTFLSWAIYKFFYPITPEFREKMTTELQAKHKQQEADHLLDDEVTAISSEG
jgi:GPH family glycoside/pentoside/hexuronide:cation symporter